jgi:mannose-6-phosphate isomerase
MQNMKRNIYPLKFIPIYKDYPWGGSRIAQTYSRTIPKKICAESWEISDREDGMSVVAKGLLAGQTLQSILQTDSTQILGTRTLGTRFPLLIKLIDAQQKLSVQVHPNDHTAATHGGEAKTEMWILLGQNPAQVFCGLEKGITPEDFKIAIQAGTTGDCLHTLPVQKDSVVFVQGGYVHAIDAGCFILEIQQNSNTTYRIHDWGRMGNDGKPRELHIEKALQAIDWMAQENPLVESRLKIDQPGFQCWTLLQCDYFTVERLNLSTAKETTLTGETFHALFVAEGQATLEWEDGSEKLIAGESILIPAALPAYTLDGNATIVRTFV